MGELQQQYIYELMISTAEQQQQQYIYELMVIWESYSNSASYACLPARPPSGHGRSCGKPASPGPLQPILAPAAQRTSRGIWTRPSPPQRGWNHNSSVNRSAQLPTGLTLPLLLKHRYRPHLPLLQKHRYRPHLPLLQKHRNRPQHIIPPTTAPLHARA